MITRHTILLGAIWGVFASPTLAEVTTVNVDAFHLLAPFWSGDTAYDEGILFLKENGTQSASAKLLFKPRTVILLRTATRLTTYTAGVDFTIDTVGRRVLLTPTSRIPSFTAGELGPDGEKHGMHYRQMVITYTHADRWPATAGEFAGTSLPLTIGKLRQRQPVTFAIMGTSISVGFNVSGYQCFDTGAVAPFQPSYGWLLAAMLNKRYGSTVTFRNHSESGTTSSGKTGVAQTVASEHPDLVIIAYGMNECSEPSATYSANVASIMSTIRQTNPTTEFIIESSTLPVFNRDGCYEALPTKRTAVQTLCGPGVASANATQLWSDIIDMKRYVDMSGNTINHPNDWGHRLLAQVHMALLSDPSTTVEISSPGVKHPTRPMVRSSTGIMPIICVRSRLHPQQRGLRVYDIRGRLVTTIADRADGVDQLTEQLSDGFFVETAER